MQKKPVEIDGSMLEGGGSIVRLSSALSALTRKPVRIRNIRAGRPQTGLRNQHLRGLQLLSDIWGGRLENARIGSMDVTFYPGRPSASQFSVTLDTAGSTGLVIQSLLIGAVKAHGRLDVAIEGGATFGLHAPPLQYIQFVLLPLLRRMGLHSEINIVRDGFYPRGGACVKVFVIPCKDIGAVSMEDAGSVESIDIISAASSDLKKPRVAERQIREAEKMLKSRGYKVSFRMKYTETSSTGSGIVLVARTSSGCILGADSIGERGKLAEDVAAEAVVKLLKTIDSGAAVDEHMGDQLLPYMALSGKACSITVPVVTSHAGTNMHILETFLPVKFTVEGKCDIFRVSCAPAKPS
ncbi:MAG: RNA 3'-terminal phosphate cyclase [Candidatus Aenigmatarchaeota archaeon]